MLKELSDDIANQTASKAMKHRDFVTSNNRKKIVHNTKKVK